MPTHYFTLKRLVAALQPYRGAEIEEVFTFRKEECVVWLRQGAEERGLVCSIHPRLSACFLLPLSWQKPRQRVSLFRSFVQGKQIVDISLYRDSRIVQFRLDDGTSLLVIFVGGRRNNVVIRQETGDIVAALKQDRLAEASEALDSEWQPQPLEAFAGEIPVLRAVARAQWRLGNLYAREVLWQVGIDLATPLQQLSASQRQQIEQAAIALVQACQASETVYLYRAEAPLPLLSLVPLQQPVELLEKVESIAGGIRRWKRMAEEWEMLRQFRQVVARQLQQRIRKAEQTLHNLSIEALHERMEQYQRFGDLLLTQPALHRKGLREIQIRDWEGKAWCIPLEPSRSLLENAQRYYGKQKALREKVALLTAKQQRTKQELAQLRQQWEQLQQIHSGKELRQFVKTYPQWRTFLSSTKDASASTQPFRRLQLGDWGIVAIGKDARSNDYVTVRWAKPNDWWFHARNVTGAHVVFRPAKPPSPDVLEAVASLAAYYSAERRASLVPVICTLRKYVRKNKRMPTGAVVVDREKQVLVVPPRSPDEVLAQLGE